jgi:hypothetical protein
VVTHLPYPAKKNVEYVIPFLLQEENRTFNLIGGTSQRRRCLAVQTDKTIKMLILYVCSWFVLVDFFDHFLVVSRSLLMVCARLYTVWSQNKLRATLISSDLSVALIVHIKRLTERATICLVLDECMTPPPARVHPL